MLEIGSGRGRDTSFFKQKRLDVTALEISSEAIKLLKRRDSGIEYHSCGCI